MIYIKSKKYLNITQYLCVYILLDAVIEYILFSHDSTNFLFETDGMYCHRQNTLLVANNYLYYTLINNLIFNKVC